MSTGIAELPKLEQTQIILIFYKETSIMTETKNNPETSNQTDLPHNPATNEEILKLLRQLVGQNSLAEQGELNPEASSDDAEIDDAEDSESHEAVDTLGEDDDDDYTDDDLETVGYIVGGAALVGAGALLYHILRKI